MSTTFRMLSSIASVLFLVAAVSAEEYAGYTGLRGGCANRIVNNGTPVIQHHASTYEEGVLRGQADLVRAMGDFYYNASLAAINAQEATDRALDNRKKAVETYFALREKNRQVRFQKSEANGMQAQLGGFAKPVAAKVLGANELVIADGILSWPTVLKRAEFAIERKAIDRLMSNRVVRADAAGTDTIREVKRMVTLLRGRLKNHIETIAPMDYVAAQKFLTAVEHEAEQPAAVARLAAR